MTAISIRSFGYPHSVSLEREDGIRTRVAAHRSSARACFDLAASSNFPALGRPMVRLDALKQQSAARSPAVRRVASEAMPTNEARWYLKLEGHRFDIEALKELGLPKVEILEYEEEAWGLTSEWVFAQQDRRSQTVLTQGSNILDRANGLAALQHSNHLSVVPSSVVAIEPDGTKNAFGRASGTIRSRGTASGRAIHSSTAPAPTPPRTIANIASDPTLRTQDLDEALALFGGDRSAQDLYIVFEIIDRHRPDSSWYSDNQKRRFKRNANLPRHAPDSSFDPPEGKSKMPDSEMAGFVRENLQKWIRSLEPNT